MRRLFLSATLLGGIGVLVWAQQPDYPQEDAGDAPDHGVARLSLINGNVSVSQGDSGQMENAAVNAPVVAGDRVLTGDGSRAEVQFDGANLVRLAPSTEVRMGELQYRRYQVQIAQGLVTLRVLRDSDAQMEISTPSISMRPLRQGTYRVMVRPDGASEITVRAGEAEAFSPSGSEPLRAGQMMMARGSAYDPEIQTATAFPNDDWDRWNADRDRYFERDMSRYVSPDIYGTEDLGNYGRWTNDPQYGSVWVPTVDADWAPYRDGRWSYIDYYGWSWISYDPWGWAPYHYGRWYRGSLGWAWYPGPIGPRYYWRPALVGFFGWGSPGFGVGYASFGFGNVGWVPLAPHEAFRPWYGRGRSFNIATNTNVVNVYRNARFTNSVTSVRAGEFGRTAIRGNNFVRASAVDLSRASAINGQMPFASGRQSRQFGSGSQVNTQGLPRVNNDSRANTRFSPSPSSSQARTPVQGTPQNGPGWRRFDQTPAQNFNSAPRQSLAPGYAPREQQPVRISPPIVNNRNEGPGATRDSGFGGTRPSYGGGGAAVAPRQPQNYAPAPFPAPTRAPQGGGYSAPAPRGPQGGGDFNTPRAPQSGGNFNAPRGPQGGGYSAPAPRGPQGGGGGGGPHGGGGPRGGGDGGGSNRSNGGGHGEGHGGGRR